MMGDYTFDEKLIALAVRGMTARAIAARLGVGLPTTKARLYRLRAAGLCPPLMTCRALTEDPDKWVTRYRRVYTPTTIRDSAAPRAKGTGQRVQTGTMGVLVGALGPDVVKAIVAKMDPGTTIAEYIAGIVKDAVLEEME
jgi:hypothetical protein